MPTIDNRIIEALRRQQLVTEYIIYPFSDLTDFQVKLTNVPSFSKEDVLVVSNKKILPHWVESKGKVWTKIPELKKNTPLKIYTLTGNPSAASGSNGTNTFALFDDFSGASLDTSKWTEYHDLTVQAAGTYTSQAGGIITINPGTVNTHSSSIVSVAKNLPYMAIITARLKHAWTTETYPYITTNYGNGALAYVGGYAHWGLRCYNAYYWGDPYIKLWKVAAGTETLLFDGSGTFGDYKIYDFFIKTNPKVDRDGASWMNGTDANILTTDGQLVSLSAGKESNGGGNLFVDYIYVRKYISPAPIIQKIRTLNKSLLLKELMR